MDLQTPRKAKAENPQLSCNFYRLTAVEFLVC